MLNAVWGAEDASGAAPVKRPPPKADPAEVILGQLESGSADEFEKAIKAAEKLLFRYQGKGPSVRHVNDAMIDWLQSLMSQKRYEELDLLALAGIRARLTDLTSIATYQTIRVHAMLSAGHPTEALAAAKSLYNVCPMASTKNAIDVVCECLVVVPGTDDPKNTVKKFRQEQVNSAASSQGGTTQPTDATIKSEVLLNVKVEPARYASIMAAADMRVDAFSRGMAKANALLLADRPTEARELCEQLMSAATDETMASATEGVARAIRAEDGTVGRANAWIISLRQHPE